MVTDIHVVEDESNSRKWDDTFFDDEEDVIEVFDFDYPVMEDVWVQSYRSVAVSNALLIYSVALYAVVVLTISSKLLVVYSATMVVIVSLDFCFFKRRIHWYVYSRHLCITREGIQLVQGDPCYGWICSTDSDKTSTFVPYDKITACDIPESPDCCNILSELPTVHVDTVSSRARWFQKHELVISGLKDPHSFREIVLAMKQATASINGQVFTVEIVTI